MDFQKDESFRFPCNYHEYNLFRNIFNKKLPSDIVDIIEDYIMTEQSYCDVIYSCPTNKTNLVLKKIKKIEENCKHNFGFYHGADIYDERCNICNKCH